MDSKKPATRKGGPRKESRKSNKNMVRVSDADYAILRKLATRANRNIRAENQLALWDWFRKMGEEPPAPPDTST